MDHPIFGYHRRYATREEARQDSFEYIQVFYNRQRRQSTLGYHSTAEYEARVAVAYLGVHGIGGRSSSHCLTTI
jgi:transposase InsO family protein